MFYDLVHWQVLNPKVVMHSAPVINASIFTIKEESRTTTKPIIANVRVFLASETCVLSPPELSSLIPDHIIKNNDTVPAKVKAQKTKLLKMTGIQSKVAIPWLCGISPTAFTQLPHGIISA